jgi:GNAT superfamily N-acetyltransferase
MSVDEVDAALSQSPPPVTGNSARDPTGGLSQYWTNYVTLANQYGQALKEDVQAYPKGLLEQLKQSGKTVLDAMGAAFAPAQSAAETQIVKPVQEGISKLGELIENHLAAEDVDWTPAERRQAQMEGRTLGRKYPQGIDWKIHKQDVRQTVEGINDAVESGVMAAVGLIGGKKPIAKPTLSVIAGKDLAEGAAATTVPDIQLAHSVEEETGSHTIKSANGELIAQEGNKVLQVKRIDVAPEARGKGEGMAMLIKAVDEAKQRGLKLESDVSVSPDAEKLYEGLKRRGYNVVQNPSERSETTGNLVSQDPRKGVFTVSEPKPRARIEGVDPATGKPRIRLLDQPTLDQTASDIRQTVRAGQQILSAPEAPPAIGGTKPADPVLYMNAGEPVTKGWVQSAFRLSNTAMEKLPGFSIVKDKIKEYTTQIVNSTAPELRGPQAEQAAAVLATNIAKQMMNDTQYYVKSADRRAFWNHRAQDAWTFITDFEKGQTHADPILNDVAQGYRDWLKDIYEGDKKLGLEYEGRDNYLPHLFKDEKGVEDFFAQRYRRKFGDPGFIKDRTFDLYEEAIKAGFKPKYTNPEDILLARQHSSDIARMRAQSLKDLEALGLAQRIEKGEKTVPEGFSPNSFRSPTGEAYWIAEKARPVLRNAFESQGLWGRPGMLGDAFRGMMGLKNTIVPIRLASMFHVLHVGLLLDNAAGMTRATKELLAGKASPVDFVKQFGSAALPVKGSFWDNPKFGSQILKAYRGEVPKGALSDVERQALGYMNDGGFIPEMSEQYRMSAMDKFRDAVQQRSAKAIFHAPFVPLGAIQNVIFEKWIPNLKTASYLKDVGSTLKADPSLINDPARRQLAFRRIAKSVDDRYGEMAYNTLFMDKFVKDVAVANTLSLSWQLGILRQHAGALRDLTEMVSTPRGFREKVAAGKMDRPLFLMYYHTQALAYGGMLTWALTGRPPTELMDYFYPKSGNQKADGTPERLNTMFTTREFAALYKHMQEKGVVGGLGTMAMNKAAGTIGLITDMASGVNGFGQEIRSHSPDTPAWQKIEQSMAYAWSDIEPISVQAIRSQAGDHPVKETALAIAGFTPAGRYITDTPTQAAIRDTYGKYYGAKQTPFDRAQQSEDAKRLKQLYDADDPKFRELLDKMQDRYSLTAEEVKRLEIGLRNNVDPTVKMFARLDWRQQKVILDKMTPDERDKYLPYSNKQHLRHSYEPPEAK